MSARTGSLIAVALTLGGLLYFFMSSSGSGVDPAGPPSLEIDPGGLSPDVGDRGNAELKHTAPDNLKVPDAPERSAVAQDEEQGEVPLPETPVEVDRETVAVLTGYVQDEEGRPVEGAILLASGNPLELMAADAFGPMAMMSGQFGKGIQESSTDENGYFEIVGIPPGQPGLRIQAAGFAPQLKRDLLIAAREHQELRSPIVLDTSAVVSGFVLDANGSPVGGARVTGKKKQAGMMGPSMSSSSDNAVETAPNGSFRLDMLDFDELEILVRHTSYSDGKTIVDTREAAVIEDLEIRLERGSSILGRVKGWNKSVAESLQVAAVPQDFSFSQGMQMRSADVAEDGSFELWGMEEGTVWSVFGRESDEQDFNQMMLWGNDGTVTTSVEAIAGTDSEVELEYRPSMTITFSVVDAATGQPVTHLHLPGGRATFFGGPTFQNYPGGRVQLEGQRPAEGETTIHLYLDAEGYEPLTETVDVSQGPAVDLGTLKLQPAVAAQFLTIDALTRLPVEGVQVSVMAQEPGEHDSMVEASTRMARALGSGDSSEARSNAEGIARVETSLEGLGLVTANVDGYGPFRLSGVELAGLDVTPFVLELRKGATVLVTTTDKSGLPLPARTIEHSTPGAEGGSMFGFSLPWDSDQSARVTDSEGVARFENLGAGVHRFRLAKLETTTGEPNMMALMMAMREGSEEEEDSWTTVEIGGSDIEEVVIVETPTGRLSGLLTEAGKPLSRATLTLRKKTSEEAGQEKEMDGAEAAILALGQEMSGQGAAGTKSKRDGSYAFESVEVGHYVLEIDHRKRAMRGEFEIEIAAGDQTLNFDLDLTILSGRVVDRNGEGVKGALVSVEPAPMETEAQEGKIELARGLLGDLLGFEGKVRTFKTKRNGSFELRGVESGIPLIVKVDGSPAGYQNATSAPFELGRNEVREDLELIVERGGAIEVTVLEADGSATDFVLVRLERSDGSMTPMNEAAMGGVKKLTGLVPGSYRVIADDNPDEDALFGDGDQETIGKVEAMVEVISGETVTVELRLPE